MVSFHGDLQLKHWAVTRVREQILAGAIKPGFGLNSAEPSELLSSFDTDYRPTSCDDLSALLGLPRWLVALYIGMFERLPNNVAKVWAISFLEGLPIDCDFAFGVYSLYAAWLSGSDLAFDDMCRPDPQAHDLVLEVARFFGAFADGHSTVPEYTRLSEYQTKAQAIAQRMYGNTYWGRMKANHLTRAAMIRIQRAMFAIEWMTHDSPVRVVECIVSAHIKSLTELQSAIILLKQGRSALVPHFSNGFGGLGYALRTERELFLVRLACWLLRWLHRILKRDAPALLDAIQAMQNSAIVVAYQNVNADLPELNLPKELIVPGKRQRTIVNGAMRIAGSALGFSGWIMIISLPLFLSFSSDHPHRYLFLLFGIGSFVLGHAFVKSARRLDAGYGWYQLLDSGRKPVIYLRSFEDDLLVDLRDKRRWPLGLWPPRTAEETFVHAICLIGPVIAISRPGSRLEPPGAARISIQKADWKEVVGSILQSASLVVILPGCTSGLRWELQHIRQSVKPERVLLYLPAPKRKEWVPCAHGNRMVFYPEFLNDLLSETLKVYYPPGSQQHDFVWFSPQWRLRPLPWIEESPSWHPRDWDGLAAQLRPLLEHHNAAMRYRFIPTLMFVVFVLAGALCFVVYAAKALR